MSNPMSGPYAVSQITDQLYLGPLPHERHVDEVRALGVDLVICMIMESPAAGLNEPPVTVLKLGTIDFPGFPIPLSKLRQGVEAALPVLERGGKVLVYCRQGRHRSVVMTCSILIAQGMTADEAMDLVTSRRKVADPHLFYIEARIKAFERYWLARRQLKGQ